MANTSNTVPFNTPCVTGMEIDYLRKALQSDQLSGDGPFTKICEAWFERHLGCVRALMGPSCTAALEMSAMLVGIEPGDEVIMPSYTFSSTANAFVLRGAQIVFVDVEPRTMNIDAELIEAAITDKTKAIVVVHYAGVCCDMAGICEIAENHDLFVVEDAAQALGASYQGKPVGGHGHLSAFSFHDTKNLTAGGEGGMLCINRPEFVEQAEILREKGTDRSKFFRGQVDKYSWVDAGYCYLPSELQAAYLACQLDRLQAITDSRIKTWQAYDRALAAFPDSSRPVPVDYENRRHNAHIYYFKCRDLEQRTQLIDHMKRHGANPVFHYVPLHSAPAGLNFGRFHGQDRYTTRESERLVRLPLWYNMPADDRQKVIDAFLSFPWS